MRKDLTGMQFGELKVLSFSHNDPDTHGPMWLCRCSCGTEKAIFGYALIHGHYKSCGCKRVAKRDQGVKEHIATDRVDGTRKSALRAKLHTGNSSGVKGVKFEQSRGKWRAYIGFKGKQINLGYYDTLAAAAQARKAGELKYHAPYKEDNSDD